MMCRPLPISNPFFVPVVSLVARSLDLASDEASLLAASVRKCDHSLAFPLIMHETALVPASIWPCEGSVTIDFSGRGISLLVRSVRFREDSLASHPVALVAASVR